MAEQRFPYGWDSRTGRYYDFQTGRFVSEKFVTEVVEARITAGFERLDAMLTAVTEGGADIARFQEAFALELRRAHTQLMALGRGGWERVEPSDWGRVGAKLRGEYAYMRNFAQEISAGRLSLGQIKVRLQMYADNTWSSYWKGDTAAKGAAGFTEEMRVLDPAAEHCSDCMGMAGYWAEIGTLPAPGEGSKCRCRCSKDYR